MEKEKGDQPEAVGGHDQARPGEEPTVLDYARPRWTDHRRPPETDSMDVAAGCAVIAVTFLSSVGTLGLLTAALSRLMSADADPFGPAFLFSGALVLAAVAVTCWRAALRAGAGRHGEGGRPDL